MDNSTLSGEDPFAFELFTATKEGDTAHINLVLNTAVRTPALLVYTKRLLKLGPFTPSTCTPNPNASVYGLLPAFTVPGDAVNVDQYDNAYWYSENGNLLFLNRSDETGFKAQQVYVYGDTLKNSLSEVVFTDNTGITTQEYLYDLTGNLRKDARKGITDISYSGYHDLPVSITNPSGQRKYRYDGTGQRTVKDIAGNDQEFFIEGVVFDQDGKVKSYQTANGYAVPNVSNQTISYFYYVKDWLGTTRSVINDNGVTENAADHYPYGMRMPGRHFVSDAEGNRYQFTGHEHDGETGYDYHGARYYNSELGRYMNVDVLWHHFPGWSVYNYVMGNPIMLIDPDGRSPESTHIDKHGNVLAVFNDGDNNVYQHGDNADGGTPTEYMLQRRSEKLGSSSGGTKVGSTKYWDEFISPETGKTMTNYKIEVGQSFDSELKMLGDLADKMSLIEVASNSGPGGKFDIKKDQPNVAKMLNGQYATSRSAGNYLAGYNANKGGISFSQFQKLAGALHVKGSLTTTQKADILLNGTSYGPAPAYGEVMYQYRMSKDGWDSRGNTGGAVNIEKYKKTPSNGLKW